MKRLLVVQVAALGYDFLRQADSLEWGDWKFYPMDPVFPALTCTTQAAFRTAAQVDVHGMPGNGYMERDLRRVFFWEQAAALVRGPRIWDAFRSKGGTVGMFFWQQSQGESADMVLSPAPIHRHHGGMIEDCYSQPADLYATLCQRLGRPFRLAHYWGPFASVRSSRWIAEAVSVLLDDRSRAPEVCFTYLPGLDYDLQRYGPDHARSLAALADVREQLAMVSRAAERNGYDLLVFGDYAIAPCTRDVIHLNRVFREQGLLACRTVQGRQYVDFNASHAFAVVDHQVAHVYVQGADAGAVAHLVGGVSGVARVLDRREQDRMGLAHPRSGDLIAVADEGAWFAYPWWDSKREAPEYAAHVDIHQKPGYDPAELFCGWPPGCVSCDPVRVRGTHGLTGPGHEAAWGSTFLPAGRRTLVELADAVRHWMEDVR